MTDTTDQVPTSDYLQTVAHMVYDQVKVARVGLVALEVYDEGLSKEVGQHLEQAYRMLRDRYPKGQ